MAGNEMAEVIGIAAVATLAHHAESRLAVSVGYCASVSRMNGRYGSTCERRINDPFRDRPASSNTRNTVS